MMSNETIPPLHRRFDEAAAVHLIRKRYRNCKGWLAQQVKVLQEAEPFRDQCVRYYARGYKDWVILGGIYGCMMNWRAKELGLNFFQAPDWQKIKAVECSLPELLYAPHQFIGNEFGVHIHVQLVSHLRSYGFDFRRKDVKPEVVEDFLRRRMRHFDLDLAHDSLFGEPPGNWPEV